jgi:predicted ArsR family transcriptional regulator
MNDTSLEAYEVIAPKINALHLKILNCLKQHGPLAASEIMSHTNIHYNTVHNRLSELKAATMVENTIERRKNSRGRNETVVKAV